MKVNKYVADFDSATAMLRALSLFLRGQDFPMLGTQPFSNPIYTLVNRLPRWLQEQIYIFGGWAEAIRPQKIEQVDSSEAARWMAEKYPRREYPAVALGSSNGATTHLFAACGIPWLPQTFLVPVRHNGLDPDEPQQAMEHFAPLGQKLLRRNPDLQLHHMHDANQDRLMIQTMGYFRLKFRRLPAAYKEFLINSLKPGATVLLVECGLRWPASRIGDRYLFQHGALGGLSPEEYEHGGPAVADLLRRHGSRRTRWKWPRTDVEASEAEWGFEPAWGEEILQLARQRGWRVQRIIFEHPEDMSPLVADFYRHFYRERGLPANRLLISSFIVMEPWWTLRTGSVPFWMVFNKQPSASSLRRYLQDRAAFREIYLMLFSHGVESAGLADISEWRELLAYGEQPGEFLGVDPNAFPRDFAVFVRYHLAAKRIAARYAMPPPISWMAFEHFLKSSPHAYSVQLTDGGLPESRPLAA
jgi:hypothetical protein